MNAFRKWRENKKKQLPKWLQYQLLIRANVLNLIKERGEKDAIVYLHLLLDDLTRGEESLLLQVLEYERRGKL